MVLRQTCWACAFWLICVQASLLPAEESPFRYDPARIDTGIAYHYLKSNIDGSNPGHVSLYIAAEDRIESLKWHEDGSMATLVTATMDWKRFSVSRFETWQLPAGGSPQRVVIASYDADQDRLNATAGETELSVKVQNWPWHSFDFDLASLNVAWRHLVDPLATFKVGITDAERTPAGPQLVDKGTVTVEFRRDADRDTHLCREYSINGPGLENKGGTIWVRKSDSVVVDYEIELPDEPGFTSAKLRLIGVDRMTPEEWSRFKSSRVR